jgi:hypothetical protein
MPTSFVHSLFFTHLMEGWVLQVPFSLQWRTLDTPTIVLSYKITLVEETSMDFGYTYSPNLIHQGASVINEILSAKWLQEFIIVKQL